MEDLHAFTLAIGSDEVVALIVLFLGGALWLIRTIANSTAGRRGPSAAEPPGGEEEEQAEESPQYTASDEQVRRFLANLGVESAQQAAPPQAPPRPAPVPPAPRRAHRPQPSKAALSGERTLSLPEGGVAAAAAAAAGSAEDRLALPHLAPLQRAVVLSEILRRRRGPHRFRD